MKVVFAGIIARYPFGGVAWCSLMYLLGLRALGHEVFYVEDTGECVYDLDRNTISEDPSYGVRHLRDTLAPHGLGESWAYVNYDGRYFGADAARVRRECADADLFVVLSGGSWFWRDEYAAIPRKVFVDSDPAFTQISLVTRERSLHEFFERFDHLFTFGANVGTPASPLPTAGFEWTKTWQPVVLDEWKACGPPRDRRFTTVMTWQMKSFTDIGGHKEVIEDNVNGFIATRPSAEALDEAMERAYLQKDRWEEIGQKARQTMLAYLPEDPVGHFTAQLVDHARKP